MCFPASPWFWSSDKLPQATSQLCPPAASKAGHPQQLRCGPARVRVTRSHPANLPLGFCSSAPRAGGPSRASHLPLGGKLQPGSAPQQGRLYHLCCFLRGTDEMASLASGRKTKRGWRDIREQREGTVLSNLLLLFWLCR